MTDTETKLKQAETDRDCYLDRANEEIDRLAKLVAEEKEPKLRHCDYGIGVDSFIHIASDTYWLGTRGDQKAGISKARNEFFINDVIGNLADELKAIAEPLEEFETDVHTYHINKGAQWAHAPIHIAGNSRTLEEAEEHSMKLRRLIATYHKLIADGKLSK